jgi:hypothetical protein
MNTHLREDVELLEGGHRLSRVSTDDQAGFTMRDRAGADQCFFDFAQRSTVEPELDESRPYIGAVDSVNPLVYPRAAPELRASCRTRIAAGSDIPRPRSYLWW